MPGRILINRETRFGRRAAGAKMVRLLRRAGVWGAGFVLAGLIIGGGALIGATSATAGPGISTTTPFAFNGMNPCTGDDFVGTGNLHFLISDNLSSSGM